MYNASRRYEQILSVVVLSLLVLGCFVVLRPFLAAIIWAFILAISTGPLFSHLYRATGERQTAAALIMTIALFLVLLVPFVIVGASLAENADELGSALRKFFTGGLPEPPAWVAGIPLVGESLQSYWATVAHDTTRLLQDLTKALRPLAATLPAVGGALLQGVLELTLSILIAFFVFRDGRPIRARAVSIANRLAGDRGVQLLDVAQNTIIGVVYGIIGTALAQGILAGVGLRLAGVPGAPLLGLLTFFLSVVPIGPPLIWGPAAIWLYYQGHPGWAVFVVLWGVLVVSSVDNFLKPLLISRGSNLPFILVLLGVFGGVVAFGFVGVFLGPTLLAVGYRLLAEWVPTVTAPAEPPSADS